MPCQVLVVGLRTPGQETSAQFLADVVQVSANAEHIVPEIAVPEGQKLFQVERGPVAMDVLKVHAGIDDAVVHAVVEGHLMRPLGDKTDNLEFLFCRCSVHVFPLV